MIYKFFDKKTRQGAKASVNKMTTQVILAIKKFKRRKAYARFKDTIWAAGVAEMERLSSKHQGVKHLLCVADVLTKYGWAKPLKGKNLKYLFMVLLKQ